MSYEKDKIGIEMNKKKIAMRQILIIIPIVLILNCNAQVNNIELNGKKYKLSFYDEFNNNQLDISKWTYRTDSKHWSTQLKENVEVKDGFLYLNLKKQKSLDKEYTGAGIISVDTFKYGYYESRLKVPSGGGWHTSFWLMNHNGSGGTDISTTTIEIDIFENDSKDTLGYDVVLHKLKNGHVVLGWKHIPVHNLKKEFQIVSCEYTPDYVKYYLNGTEVKSIDINNVPQGALNIWLTCIASHLGDTKFVDKEKLPNYAVFDYVRYYKLTE